MSKMIIWSKAQCPACEQAKGLLSKSSIEFEERKIGNGWTKEDLLAVVPSARAVPQIIVDGKHIGGVAELTKYLQG